MNEHLNITCDRLKAARASSYVALTGLFVLDQAISIHCSSYSEVKLSPSLVVYTLESLVFFAGAPALLLEWIIINCLVWDVRISHVCVRQP